VGQLFYRHESVNRFLNNGILQNATDSVSELQDLFGIVSLMACIVKNFNNMQLAPAMADCMDLYRRTTTHFCRN